MADIRRELQPQPLRSGMNVSDILFAVFRCKWTIVFCTLLGLAGAAAVYYWSPPAYQSQAKLLVRYVVERSGGYDQRVRISATRPQSAPCIGDLV